MIWSTLCSIEGMVFHARSSISFWAMPNSFNMQTGVHEIVLPRFQIDSPKCSQCQALKNFRRWSITIELRLIRSSRIGTLIAIEKQLSIRGQKKLFSIDRKAGYTSYHPFQIVHTYLVAEYLGKFSKDQKLLVKLPCLIYLSASNIEGS